MKHAKRKKPPKLARLLGSAVGGTPKPVAFVLAGHNGSGKSTLWKERLSPSLKIPLVNADRLTASILPERELKTGKMPRWAENLRDKDDRWQRLSQDAVRALVHLIMANRMPFATETVFSHWKEREDGTVESKADLICELQTAGYYVVLIFVGLVSSAISALRVVQRSREGGHSVPLDKIVARFPRTQKAIGHAAPIADMTIMFDNSFDERRAFSLVRVQQGKTVLFDCRDVAFVASKDLRRVATRWLQCVVGEWEAVGATKKAKGRGRRRKSNAR